MIVKGYSCEYCTHKEVCGYKKDMTELWDKIQLISYNFYLPEFKHDLSLPSVGYYSLKCTYYKDKE